MLKLVRARVESTTPQTFDASRVSNCAIKGGDNS